MEVKIEKNVPIPPQSWRIAKYPFHEMEVGDSLLIDYQERNAVLGAAKKYGKDTEKDFTSKRVSETEARIWRTK